MSLFASDLAYDSVPGKTLVKQPREQRAVWRECRCQPKIPFSLFDFALNSFSKETMSTAKEDEVVFHQAQLLNYSTFNFLLS